MATRRRLLAFLTRAELLQLAADCAHSGLTGKPKDEIVEAIVERPRPSKPEVLEYFSRHQLKEACEELGLDSTGREKQLLIGRLLGREDEEDRPVELLIDDGSRGVTRMNIPPVKLASNGKGPKVPPEAHASGPTMLTRMRLKNLKTWGEQLWGTGVELSAITLFLGANSAGKTSLLQLPLLLKQTFESPDRLIHLNLGGQSSDLVDLGSYKSLIHQHETRRELGIGLSANVAREGEEAASLDYEATYMNSPTGPVVLPKCPHRYKCATRPTASSSRPPCATQLRSQS